MAHLLKQKDAPEPGVWRSVSGDQARDWRRGVRDRMEKAPRGAVTTEFDVGRHQGLEVAPGTAEQGVIEPPPARENPREPRDTVEQLTKLMLDWVFGGTKDEAMHRVRIVKKSSGMSHLTDEEAANDLHNLAVKVAKMDAERRYKEMALLRNTLVVPGGVSLRAGA